MDEEQDRVRKRLQQLIESSGESLAAISRRIDRNPAYIQQFLRRGVPRRLAEQDRRRLARHFRVPEQELGGGAAAADADGAAPLPLQATIVPESAGCAVSGPQQVSVIIIPFLGAAAPADPDGSPLAGFVLESAIGRRISGGRPGSLGAMMADGDAMVPTINAGDVLLFDTALQTADRCGLYVLQGPHAPMIRRIAIDPVDGGASIIADNPAYPVTRCAPDAIPVVGRILWAGKPIA